LLLSLAKVFGNYHVTFANLRDPPEQSTFRCSFIGPHSCLLSDKSMPPKDRQGSIENELGLWLAL
jgi:hypothetical protein